MRGTRVGHGFGNLIRLHNWVGPVIWALSIVALALTGCSSGSDESTEGAAANGAQAAPAPRSGAADSAAGGQVQKRTDAQQRAVPEERAIVYTAHLTVRVKDVAAAGRQAEDIATAAGGLVTDEQSDTSGDRVDATSRLTIRVPPTEFRTVLGKLAGLGDKLTGAQSATDVTTQVVDVEARIAAQRRSVARVQALLDRARNIGEIVSIESELARREADLDALLARQKELSQQTDRATVTVTLVGPEAEGPKEEPELGFLSGLRSGWDGLAASVAVLLTILGAVLPFLGVAVLLWWPARWTVRRLRTARVSEAAATPAATPPAS
jgi:hypothetical protein